ncbi:hypothetical protein PBCV1_a385L [Paramecium bursaria Chlorella virus 1]|uniref:Uncharacterized protein n=1 Tax=Paramecium bursaria Chlorella virus 1 TaxID=10506 RepID=Q98437_PBCV1|nr:hypothetical protein PBCV1_a385L [Paramecium bursaria Chlorella virus 1]AAC96753.1 hypothetical protein [Paramecium bursaria Chlorella virus 1]
MCVTGQKTVLILSHLLGVTRVEILNVTEQPRILQATYLRFLLLSMPEVFNRMDISTSLRTFEPGLHSRFNHKPLHT